MEEKVALEDDDKLGNIDQMCGFLDDDETPAPNNATDPNALFAEDPDPVDDLKKYSNKKRPWKFKNEEILTCVDSSDIAVITTKTGNKRKSVWEKIALKRS